MEADTVPVGRSRDEARRTYDRLSRWYDWFAADEWSPTLSGLRLLDPGPGEKVLEIGPGTGRALAWIAKTIRPTGLAVGLDLSSGMLARARGAVERSRVPAGLCQGDALSLPFPTGRFDLLFMGFTLELFDTPEIPAVLAECARVLRPGGRIGLVALLREDRFPVRLYEWFHDRWPVLVDCRPIHASRSLGQAGFRVRDSRRSSLWGLPVEIVRAETP